MLAIVDFSIFQEQKYMRREVTMSTSWFSYSLTLFKSLENTSNSSKNFAFRKDLTIGGFTVSIVF
jgi:hypothetical protein